MGSVQTTLTTLVIFPCHLSCVDACAGNAELLQRCLARLILWKDQLLQHCLEHESALRQYCMDVDSAMAAQEQKLMGQAANYLQQRNAALSALHRVEDEVQHLKGAISVRGEVKDWLRGLLLFRFRYPRQGL